MNKFTAVFERDGNWWIGYVEELPGANTQGRTLPEARESLKEAVWMIIGANRELMLPSCPPLFCRRICQHPTSTRGCPRIRLEQWHGRGITITFDCADQRYMRNVKNVVLGVRMYASISKVAFDGQITIPAEIRRKKKIDAGCDLLFIDVEGAIIIKKMDESKKTFDVFDERTKELNLSLSELNDLVGLEKQHTWDEKYAKGDD